jgi:GT2 family glycosyltransferase
LNEIKYSIIVLTFNSEESIEKCVNSIVNQKNFLSYELIIIDNGSTDSTVLILHRLNIKVIQTGRNLGYGGGMNIGAKYAKGKYLIFVNPDIIFPRETLSNLNQLNLDRKTLGCPIILFADKGSDYINALGVQIHPTGISWASHHNEQLGNFLKQEVEFEPFAPSGACFIIERNLFIHLKGFNSQFFMYMEEVEFAWKARLRKIKVKILPDILVFHKYEKKSRLPSYQTKIQLLDRNRLYTLLMNYEKRTLLRLLPLLIILEISMIISFIVQGNLKTKVLVYSELIRSRDLIRKDRQIVQNMREVSDNTILNEMEVNEVPKYMGNEKLFALFFKISRFLIFKLVPEIHPKNKDYH